MTSDFNDLSAAPEPGSSGSTYPASVMNPQGTATEFHRELSWLRFNHRVLEEATDPRLPLTERARFMSIVASNLDEFVMVRFAALLSGEDRVTGNCGMDADTALAEVRRGIEAQVSEHYSAFRALAPELHREGLALVPRKEWTEREQRRVEAYFRQSLELILTPLAVGPSHPFPLLGNLRLYLAVALRAPGDEEERFAMVGVPSGEARLFRLGEGRFALLEEVVAAYVGQLFPGFSVRYGGTVRVTRDGTIDIDEDQGTDLLTEIEQGLRLRGRGAPVRLEVEASVPERVREWLCEELHVSSKDLFAIDGPLDLRFLGDVADLSPRLEALAVSTV